jgi:hypothetical protein
MNKKPMLNNQIISITGNTTDLKAYNLSTDMNNYDTFQIDMISYASNNVTDVLYYLWCSYTHCYVASFTINTITATHAITTVTPKVLVNIKNPINTLHFILYVFNEATGLVNEVMGVDLGYINIVLSFTKY